MRSTSRWEVVATLTAGSHTWVMPISEGLYFRRNRLSAALTARSWTRTRVYNSAAARGLQMRWTYRRYLARHTKRPETT